MVNANTCSCQLKAGRELKHCSVVLLSRPVGLRAWARLQPTFTCALVVVLSVSVSRSVTMSSVRPGTSNLRNTGRRLTAKQVLQEIFHDSDSADGSDSDSLDCGQDDVESEQSTDEEVQPPPAKRGKPSVARPEFMWSGHQIQPGVYPFTGRSEVNADLLATLPAEPKPGHFFPFFCMMKLLIYCYVKLTAMQNSILLIQRLAQSHVPRIGNQQQHLK